MNFDVIPELTIELGQIRSKGYRSFGGRVSANEFSNHS